MDWTAFAIGIGIGWFGWSIVRLVLAVLRERRRERRLADQRRRLDEQWEKLR